MPTESLKSILDRELAIASSKELIDIASPLLKECINWSIRLHGRCQGEAGSEIDVDVAPLMLFLHSIEMADSVELSISGASAVPAYLLVRSMFEANLSLRYIVENEEEYSNRSLSWLTSYILDSLDYYEMLDPNTESGKEFIELKSRDRIMKDMGQLHEDDSLEEEINAKSRLLNKPHISDIIDEIDNYKKRIKERGRRPTRRIKWYALFNGPGTNLRESADRLDMGATYKLLYPSLSSITHASSPGRFFGSEEGQQYFKPIRGPKEIPSVTIFACDFLLEAIQLVINHFRPQDHELYIEWYDEEINEPLIKFGSL